MSTEQNPRDRLFDPDSDTADVRDREDGPEPVDETEDTIRDPARFSDSPDDMTAAPSPAARDDAIDTVDEPGGMDESERGDGDRGAGDLDRQSPRSATALAETSDMSGEAVDERLARADEGVGRTAADGGRVDAAERAEMRAAVPAAAALPGEQPSDEAPGGPETPDVEDGGALLPSAETYRLRIRWREVQLGFVDDPRQAVDDAAELVSLAVDRVASLLRDQVGALNDDGPRGDADGGEPDTERLRILMRRYHALLDRILAV